MFKSTKLGPCFNMVFLFLLTILCGIGLSSSENCSACGITKPSVLHDSSDLFLITRSDKKNATVTNTYNDSAPRHSLENDIIEEERLVDPDLPPQRLFMKPLIVAPGVNREGDVKQLVIFQNSSASELELTAVFPKWMGRYVLHCHTRYSCHQFCTDSHSLVNTNARGCSCDKMCTYFGDCCQDYFSECESLKTEDEVERFVNNTASLADRNQSLTDDDYSAMIVSKYGTCQSMGVYTDDNSYLTDVTIWKIDKCPDNIMEVSDFDVRQACEQQPQRILFSHPVSYRWNPKVVYKNIYCAFCHGIELRDISFWSIQIHTDELKLQTAWSIDDILNLVENTNSHGMTMAPVLPKFDQYRSCSLLNEMRCHGNSENKAPKSSLSVSLDAKMCGAYLRPFEYNFTMYANIHCLACQDSEAADQDQIALSTCPFNGFMMHGAFKTSYMAVVSFKDGKFCVFTRNKNTGNVNQVYESIRHENCSRSSREKARQNFFETCISTLCEGTNPPGKNLVMSELECSIRQHSFIENYNQHIDRDGYSMIITMNLQHESLLNHLRAIPTSLEKVFQQVVLKDVESPTNTYELQEMRLEKSSIGFIMELFIQWKTSDHLISILRQAGIFDSKLREIFGRDYFGHLIQPLREQINTNVVMLNFKSLTCESGKLREFRNVPLIPHQYQSWILIENSVCYLDLERLAFRTSYTGDGNTPNSIDSVFVCQNEELESFCEFIFSDRKGDTVVSVHKPVSALENPDKNKKTQKVPSTANNSIETDRGTIINTLGNAHEDLETFQNVCFTVSLLGQLFKIINIFMKLRLGKGKDDLPCFFTACSLVSHVFLIVLVLLILISKEIRGLDDFLMGVLCHFCWLIISGAACVNAFHIKKATGWNYVKGLSQSIFLIIALDLIICSIVEQEEIVHAEIGYTHKTKHMFWISNKIPCSIALIAVCSVFFFLAFVVKFVNRYGRSNNKDGSDAEERNEISRDRKVCFNTGHDLLLLFAFVIGVIDYYQVQNDLWPLLFSLALFCLGIWQAIQLALSYQRYTNSYSKAGISSTTIAC